MHQLLLAVAKKGCGKSTAVCNLLSFLHKDKCLDRLLVITSSLKHFSLSLWESNKPLFDFLNLPIDKEDVYDADACAVDTIHDIISKATQETKEYDEYHVLAQADEASAEESQNRQGYRESGPSIAYGCL